MARAFLILLLLMVCPSVLAVGIGNLPQQREFIFSPGAEVSVPLRVINGEHIQVRIAGPQGDPAALGTPADDNILSYVSLDDPAPGTGERHIHVRFRFGQYLRPGVYPVTVTVTDTPPEQASGTITAVATTQLRLTVRSLSHEKLLEIQGVSVPPIAEGLPANATVHVVSRTVQPIGSAVALVTVYADGVPVASARSGAAAVPSGQGAALAVVLPTEQLRGGTYDINATVDYDGALAGPAAAHLKVGTLRVFVDGHTGTMVHNATNRFVFNVSSRWNRELRDVHAVVLLGGQEKRTAGQHIPPFGAAAFEAYFDRDPSLAPGPATVNLSVSYQDFNTESGEYARRVESFLLPVELVVAPAEEQPMDLRLAVIALSSLLVILLIALIILLLGRKERTPRDPAAPGNSGGS